jgi:hypothetical protein
VYAIDDLGYVLLFVKIHQLEAEKVWKLDFGEELEEVRVVVGMSILQLRVSEYPQGLSFDCLYDFGQGNTISKCLFQLDDRREIALDDVFHPLLGLSNMAEVFVRLQELSLLVHPVSTGP